MRVALFATGSVGLEVARLLAAHQAEVPLLVLDQGTEDRALAEVFESSGTDVIRSGGHREQHLAGEVSSRRIELALLAWWPYLLHHEVIEAVSRATLNFHPSLLPHCRGKDPNFWSIVEERPFGVTIHHVALGIDEGPVAFQREIPVSWSDTGGTLYAEARAAVVALFEEHIEEILAGEIPRLETSPEAGSVHRRAELDPASRISLEGEYTGRALLNILRARTFAPHPGAWFEDESGRFEVRVEIRPRDDGS